MGAHAEVRSAASVEVEPAKTRCQLCNCDTQIKLGHIENTTTSIVWMVNSERVCIDCWAH